MSAALRFSMANGKQKTIYKLQKLIPGSAIGMEGWYAAVPEEGYKGHPFKIQYLASFTDSKGERHYDFLEVAVNDWNRAVAFRKQPQTIPGRTGFYTLGYFKMRDMERTEALV